MASNWYAGSEGTYPGSHHDTSGDPYGTAAATLAAAPGGAGSTPPHEHHGQYGQHGPHGQFDPFGEQGRLQAYDVYGAFAHHDHHDHHGGHERPAAYGSSGPFPQYGQHDEHAPHAPFGQVGGYATREERGPLTEPAAEPADFGHFPGLAGSADAPAGPATPDATASPAAAVPASLAAPSEDAGEWNPGEDDLRPLRGRHRVARRRGGTVARSRAVLGVGVIAAVGAGGMATANDDGAGSVPGLGDATDKVKAIPDSIPLIGGLVPGSGGDSDGSDGGTPDVVGPEEMVAQAPFTAAGITQTDIDAGATDAGEALRTRILQQADQQEADAAAEAREQAVADAEAAASDEAAALAEAERIAEEERRRQEEEERRRQEEEERLRQLRASYIAPLTDYTFSSYFGETSSYWATTHTGQDFAAPTGTPVMNVHTGVVTEAAWAGDYGYRIIVTLEDGTEIWYCHLSSINVSVGQEVVTQDVIGNVGSTGNSSGPHLHLEVRPGAADPIDPLAWLREQGVAI